MFQEMLSSSYLSGANAAFVEDLYEQYLQDPASMDGDWREYFDGLAHEAGGRDIAHRPIVEAFEALAKRPPSLQRQTPAGDLAVIERKQVSVLQLINAYRFLGVRHARVDPLERTERPYLPELDPAHYGFTAEDMDTVFNTGSLVGPDELPLRDIIRAVQETYYRHHRFRVHAHRGHAAEALDPGAAGEHATASRSTKPDSGAGSWSGSPQRKASNAICTRATSGRSASPAKGANPSLRSSITCCSGREHRAWRRP